MEQIEPILRENLLVQALAYSAATGTTLGRLSRICHGDPPFFERLIREEGTISARKYDEVMSWFDGNWPEKTARPKIRKVFAGVRTK